MMTKLMNLILRSLRSFDWPLLLILLAFFGLSMLVMHSAVGSTCLLYTSDAADDSVVV